MNVGQIKTRIANLFHKTIADCTVASEDMIVSAMNSAKLLAEQTHDFEGAKALVQITISSSQGAALSTATLLGTATPALVRSILNVSVLGEDGVSLSPIDFRKRDSVMAELRKINRVDRFDPTDRYLDESESYIKLGTREVMQWGSQIMLRPMLESGSVTLVMEAYVNMPDYTVHTDLANAANTYTDFFTDFGHNYLVWQTVIELNHYWKTFVYREEGNLTSPDKLAEKYLAQLINWDIYNIAEGLDVTGD